MNTYDTAKTISDLFDYYCMRCNVGLCDCKISAMECLKISSDRDFVVATNPKILADHKTEQTDCDTCRYSLHEWYSQMCDSCCKAHSNYVPRTEGSKE